MVQLCDLPEDIVHLTLKQIVDRQDLSSLSRSCKVLHGRVLPALYADIDWSPSDREQLRRIDLLRSVLEKPALASYIKTFKIRPWRRETFFCGVRPGDRFCLEKRAESFIYEMEFPHPDAWVGCLNAGSADAWAAIVLSQAHQLQNLDYTFSSFSYVAFILKHALTSSPQPSRWSHFSRLTTITYSPVRQDFQIALFHLLPLLNLPTVKTINISSLGDYPLKFHSQPFPKLTTLKTLTLFSTTLNELHLLPILSLTPSLECLTYALSVDTKDNTGPFLCQEFSRGLFAVRETLTHLALSISFTSSSLSSSSFANTALKDRWNVEHLLSSFASFPVLSHLTVPIIALLGHDVDQAPDLVEQLPPALEVLVLTDDRIGDAWTQEEVVTKIAELLDAKKDSSSSSSQRWRKHGPATFEKFRELEIRLGGEAGSGEFYQQWCECHEPFGEWVVDSVPETLGTRCEEVAVTCRVRMTGFWHGKSVVWDSVL